MYIQLFDLYSQFGISFVPQTKYNSRWQPGFLSSYLQFNEIVGAANPIPPSPTHFLDMRDNPIYRIVLSIDTFCRFGWRCVHGAPLATLQCAAEGRPVVANVVQRKATSRYTQACMYIYIGTCVHVHRLGNVHYIPAGE